MTQQDRSRSSSVYVLDTSAFVAGFDPFALADLQVTVPLVEEEIQRNNMIKTRFYVAVESGKIKIKQPKDISENLAKVSASKVGDAFKLSKVDMQLLSLALELKSEGHTPQIVSDDYSIQNVAVKLGIKFTALSTFGIKKLIEWVIYCPACYKQYAADCKFKKCQICGTELKRKPKRQKKI
ncbi:MAG: hypothetical protein PHY74_07435 [Candidatus Bathyarchaeota archaeon]|jgi:UPF0271 protein|nr:hypothetical protein [Candidatus Bathyarchaeota archaeon]MDD4325770.1 hypothetical protein [Candidatus Bathyarchaeota archaeon]MDI9576669.1 hypothetical protein [Thermoproteota archaeon]NLD67046.1 hypothetical protein [Thermoproteota archaeon]